MQALQRHVPDLVEPLTFDAVYAATFDMAYRLLRRLGVPEASLDDAAQEVFVTVHRRLAGFEGRSTPKTWVAGIAVRVASDVRRALRRRGEPVELSEQLVDPRSGPAEAASAAEALRLVQRLLNRLDDDQREVFVLVEMEQLTAPEISAALGVNLSTVYSRLRLARAAFDEAVAKTEVRDE